MKTHKHFLARCKHAIPDMPIERGAIYRVWRWREGPDGPYSSITTPNWTINTGGRRYEETYLTEYSFRKHFELLPTEPPASTAEYRAAVAAVAASVLFVALHVILSGG